jgi:hypothetical protein
VAEVIWKSGRRLCFNNKRLWLWVPAFAGTTRERGSATIL